MPTHQGSIRLFRAAGIVVFLHCPWFLVAFYEINGAAEATPLYHLSTCWNTFPSF
jgi:hypothetical protein